MARPRPLVIVDTSIFVRDALSEGKGAASQVLTILPGVAHVLLCKELRDEVFEKLKEHAGWTRAQINDVYGPIFDGARLLDLVPEREDHRKAVSDDLGDTMLVRLAEAAYMQATDLLAADQVRFIVTANSRHLRPGGSYAGFEYGSAHALLLKLNAEQAEPALSKTPGRAPL